MRELRRAEPKQNRRRAANIYGEGKRKRARPCRRERIGKICGPRSPTGRAGTVIGMGIYGPRLQGGTYIGKKIWALANSERHIRNGDGMGLDGSRNQSGTAYGPPPPRGGAMRELRGAEPHITESGKHLYSQPKRKRKRKLITIYR